MNACFFLVGKMFRTCLSIERRNILVSLVMFLRNINSKPLSNTRKMTIQLSSINLIQSFFVAQSKIDFIFFAQQQL